MVNPRRRIRIRTVGQVGGARTKGSLKRQYAADALLTLAGNTPLRRPGTGGKTRNINNILNSIERSPRQASTPDASPISNDNLLMVKQFKIANPTAKASDLHALSAGWKLHGTALGEERKGYRAACLRMGALIGEKMYSNPNSSWMNRMRNGEAFDLLQEYNKLKQSPMATSTNVTAAVVVDTITRAESRSRKRNKATSPIAAAVRKSNRVRKAPVMFGRGRKNQKGGFLPLLALAAPALAKLVL